MAGLAAHAAYVMALLGGAVAVYAYGHRAPSGPGADWAYWDAAFSTGLAVGLVVFSCIHILYTLAWFGDPRIRWVLTTTLPVVALVGLVWFARGFDTLPGWKVVLTALIAAFATVVVPLIESKVVGRASVSE